MEYERASCCLSIPCPGVYPACAVVSIESDRIPGFPTGGEACFASPFDKEAGSKRRLVPLRNKTPSFVVYLNDLGK